MFFGDFYSSEEFDSPLTFFDLDLSPLKEVRFRSESDIERELEFIEDPDYIPPPTPCNESYKTKDMSSEETLSVGGSEEVRMVKEVSIGTESSGLERTVEEVGGEEGVKGERVPLNILEVDGACERCYDVEADIVSEVIRDETKWPNRESLVHIVETYDLPLQMLIRPTMVEERACSTPRDHWMLIYAHYLLARLRFPIPELLVGLLLEYSIVPYFAKEMDKFLIAIGGATIPKKSKTSFATVTTSQEGGSEDVGPTQKRMKVEEYECSGDEVVEFVPRPPLVELDPKVKERFINSTFLEVDRCRAQEKVLSHGGVGIVKHVLEAMSLVNALSHEFFETLKECNVFVKEKEELGKKKEEVEKDLKRWRMRLGDEEDYYPDEEDCYPNEEDCFPAEEERQYNAILAFLDYKKKVKAQRPELDVTGITFGEQEEGMEEDGESMIADFCLEVQLKWDHDSEGRTIVPPNFDFKFVAVEKREPKARSVEAEGAVVAENEPEKRCFGNIC
ncbi:hypothetical protein SLEP1_g44134 [Rubroshorea leprosula]|uniref:Uncharacterized protein n=1 Tax=Rubroshorea leprosula TaxID=152421 RepID=A0AAV5LFL6_9ROSI|nr:hypothetical protein SLEP1_g44134 [Rubroshorea leprosula]